MKDMNYTLLYVDNPPASAAFYAGLLDKEPVESSPGFALFVLDSGVKLGLWSKHTVEPGATPVGGSELGFSVADRQTVDAHYEVWKGLGMRIAQAPTDLDFGYTFVALDPDGHRLRVFAMAME
ncbi:MAG TPA: VOC family protein [Burkholderiaceae bacterium]